MSVVLRKDYAVSGKRPITMSKVPTMSKQSPGGLIERNWVGAERVDVAATQAVKVWLLRSRIAEL